MMSPAKISPFQENIRVKLATKKPSEILMSFAFHLNLAVILIITFCANGLGRESAELFMLIAAIGLVFNIVLQLIFLTFQRTCLVSNLASELIEDGILIVALIVNTYASPSIPEIWSLWFVVLAVSTRSLVSVRLFSTFIISKTLMFSIALYWVNGQMALADSLPIVVLSLCLAYALLLVLGYWLYAQKVQLHHLNFIQNDLHQQLNSEHRLREKIVRHVGHDLRQPINAIHYALHTSLLQLRDQHQKSHIKNALTSVQTANHLVEEILQVSTYRSDNSLAINLEVFCLRDLLELLEYEYAGVAIQSGCTFQTVPSTVIVKTDWQILLRILRNFISNALRYAKGSRVVLGVRRKKNGCVIQVLDNGPGIPESVLETVFEEFSQGDSDDQNAGFGLGLCIAKRLAESLHADIHISSKITHGTVCSLTLPTELL